MERKLADYRAKKEREARISNVKEKMTNTFISSYFKTTEHPNEANEPHVKEPIEVVLSTDSKNSSDIDDTDSVHETSTTQDVLQYILWLTLWIVLYLIFIEFQFGTVFLITSAIAFMYINTRSGPKKPGEISAYSVFNKNCESIDGTLNAEQFEREIRYGAGGVR